MPGIKTLKYRTTNYLIRTSEPSETDGNKFSQSSSGGMPPDAPGGYSASCRLSLSCSCIPGVLVAVPRWSRKSDLSALPALIYPHVHLTSGKAISFEQGHVCEPAVIAFQIDSRDHALGDANIIAGQFQGASIPSN